MVPYTPRNFAMIAVGLIVLTLNIANACAAKDGPFAVQMQNKIIKVLSGNNVVARQRAMITLKEDAGMTQALLGGLVQIAKNRIDRSPATQSSDPFLVEMVRLVGTVDAGESHEFLINLLDGPHTAIAMIAADTLGQNRRLAAIDKIQSLAKRPEYLASYGFRFNVIRSLAKMNSPDAFAAIDQLKNGLDGQLRFECDKLLTGITPATFDDDRAAFDRWTQSKAQKIKLASTGSDSQSRERIILAPSQYYGIDIHAKRMLFILDISGSMDEAEYDLSRLNLAKRELFRVIGQLPNDCEFSIMVFNTSIDVWHRQLVVATDHNKREAIAFLTRLGAGYQTNTHGAIRTALEFDNQLEAIYLLTDGRPTVGAIIYPPAIVEDVIFQNQFRHLNINTIGIAVDGPMKQFLEALAENGAGEFRAVR